MNRITIENMLNHWTLDPVDSRKKRKQIKMHEDGGKRRRDESAVELISNMIDIDDERS